MILQPNTLFANRYRLVRKLGSGGFSEVWLAEDTRGNNIRLAIKVFSPGNGLDSKGLRTFADEYSLVYHLNHPYLLKATHYDEWDGMPYLNMPYMERGSCSDLCGEFTEAELAKFLVQIGSAVEYLHAQDPPIIHQDIKPDNVLIDTQGNYLLTDFGISTKIRRTLTKSMGNQQGSSGTTAYMAPERFSKKLDEREPVKANDVFSLGVTVFELLTDRLPYGEQGGILATSGLEPAELPESFSAELRHLLAATMQKNPWDRPTAQEVVMAAKEYLNTMSWLLTERFSGKTTMNIPEEMPEMEETALTTNVGVSRYSASALVMEIESDMVLVRGGTFTMGCTGEQGSDSFDREKPAHRVTLSNYYISKYGVTFEQYDAFCDATGRGKPSDHGWGRGRRPVINVSWHDAVAFCEWLSRETGKRYRLPTEAEWEYAARGGSRSRGFKYSGSNDLGAVAWHSTNSGNNTQPVGRKSPNELGLYDMSGNVWEWCSDWYGSYSSSSKTNPTGPSSDSYRVLRGGGWYRLPQFCRVASRYFSTPDLRFNYIGFRLVFSP